ncbi:MAG TPA: hypothetical protein PLO23_00420, partial [Alphaproteobacteria bacterium]|nr:hypothetical protein [Alphaproteobacteria bacterium]
MPLSIVLFNHPGIHFPESSSVYCSFKQIGRVIHRKGIHTFLKGKPYNEYIKYGEGVKMGMKTHYTEATYLPVERVREMDQSSIDAI